jgi:simple sugar transport system permease protein
MLGALVFASAEVFATYSLILNLPIPDQFLLMIPFILTLVILIISYRRADLPQALGKAYDRESVED